MIIKDSERSTKVRVAMREGPGQVIIKDVCGKEDLYEKGRLYAQMVLEKDCGIGVHEHKGEKEIGAWFRWSICDWHSRKT